MGGGEEWGGWGGEEWGGWGGEEWEETLISRNGDGTL